MSVENKPELKTEIRPEVKAEINPEINKINANPEAKLDINQEADVIKSKRNLISSRFSNLAKLRLIIRPNFITGVLIGSALSYYLNNYRMGIYLNTKQTFLNEEIDSLKNEIKEMRVKKQLNKQS